MSQLDAHNVHLNGQQVTAYIAQMLQRDESMRENYAACREAVMEAAQLYKEENDDDKLKLLREQLLKIISVEQDINVHKAALSQMQRSYQPTLEKTDFTAVLGQHASALQTSFHPERDSDLQELDQLAGTAATGDDDMDSDEDIVVTTGEVNQKCPYTMKEGCLHDDHNGGVVPPERVLARGFQHWIMKLIDLKEPVEDQKGVVYEAAAIKSHIAKSHGSVEAPLAGATHRVTLQDLKPCRRILRLQKQRQKQGARPGDGAGPSTQRGSRVLDV